MTLKGTNSREKITMLIKALVMWLGGLVLAVFGFLRVKEGADDAITGAVVFFGSAFALVGFLAFLVTIFSKD